MYINKYRRRNIYSKISLRTRLASEEREANGIAALFLNQQHTYFNRNIIIYNNFVDKLPWKINIIN